MSKVSARERLLHAIYQDNLEVAGKRKAQRPAIRRAVTRVASSRHASFYFLIVVLSAAVLSSAALAYWNLSQPQLPLAASVSPEAVAASHEIGAATLEPSLTKRTSAGPVDLSDPYLDETIYTMRDEHQVGASEEQLSQEAIDQLQSLATPEVPLAKLFGLGVRTIVIDPGHGGKDPGATGHLGTHEKDLTLEIAKRLRDRLQAYGDYKVLMTRETDEFQSLNERVHFANDNHADLFVSIHINYFPSDRVNFVETYYFGPNADSEVAELAARENSESQYRYADFKEMVKKVGDTLKFQESRELALSVQENLFSEIKHVNTRAQDHGIKPGPFVVLLGIDAPSILTEVTSLNNKQEEKRLKSPAYRDKIATFLEKGIVNYLTKNHVTPGERNGQEKENLAQAQEQ